MRRFAIGFMVSGLLAFGAACAPPEPPANPAWDTDVYPILRGSCLHCHGSNWSSAAPPWRFDVCNKASFASVVPSSAATEIGQGATDLAILNLIKMDLDDSKGRPDMPPPPALPLSDYDRQVVTTWVDNALKNQDAACKKASPNRKPSVKLINTRKDGGTAWATLEIDDLDGDTVMGTVTIGGQSAAILSLGRKEYKVDNASDTKVSIKITDGWDTVENNWN